MRFRDTLLARILGGFLLNLLMVGLVLWGLYELRVGPASALAGLSEDRVRRAASALSDQLVNAPRADWPQIVQRHNQRHGVTFHLRNARGGSLLLNAAPLPAAVREQLTATFPPPSDSPIRRHLARQLQPLQLNAAQLDQIETIWLNSLREFQQTKNLAAAMAAYTKNVRAVLTETQRENFAQLTPINFTPNIRTESPSPAEWHRRFDADQDGDLNATELAKLLADYSPTESNSAAGPLPDWQPQVRTFTLPDAQHVWAALEISVRVREVGREFSTWEVQDLRKTPDSRRFNAILLLESDPVLGESFFAEPWPWVTILLLIIGLSALFWLPLIQRITRPLAKVTALTEEIAEGNFQNRVDLEQPDEIGRLAHAVDQMAHRLEGFARGQRRFLGDVSHELCAPLARLQMALEVLAETASPEQKEMLGDLREEVEQMATLVDELLCFTRTGETKAIELQPVDLAALIEANLQREAPDLAHDVKLPANLTAYAAPDRLERALANIFRNAQQHAATGKKIQVRAEAADESVEIKITDFGPGVPADCLDQLFDPFFRPEDSRTRETGGTGLGLAIAKSAVEASGGTLQCRLHEQGGLQFILRLKPANE
jgi:signal transduction histidine kinase